MCNQRFNVIEILNEKNIVVKREYVNDKDQHQESNIEINPFEPLQNPLFVDNGYMIDDFVVPADLDDGISLDQLMLLLTMIEPHGFPTRQRSRGRGRRGTARSRQTTPSRRRGVTIQYDDDNDDFELPFAPPTSTRRRQPRQIVTNEAQNNASVTASQTQSTTPRQPRQSLLELLLRRREQMRQSALSSQNPAASSSTTASTTSATQSTQPLQQPSSTTLPLSIFQSSSSNTTTLQPSFPQVPSSRSSSTTHQASSRGRPKTYSTLQGRAVRVRTEESDSDGEVYLRLQKKQDEEDRQLYSYSDENEEEEYAESSDSDFGSRGRAAAAWMDAHMQSPLNRRKKKKLISRTNVEYLRSSETTIPIRHTKPKQRALTPDYDYIGFEDDILSDSDLLSPSDNKNNKEKEISSEQEQQIQEEDTSSVHLSEIDVEEQKRILAEITSGKSSETVQDSPMSSEVGNSANTFTFPTSPSHEPISPRKTLQKIAKPKRKLSRGIKEMRMDSEEKSEDGSPTPLKRTKIERRKKNETAHTPSEQDTTEQQDDGERKYNLRTYHPDFSSRLLSEDYVVPPESSELTETSDLFSDDENGDFEVERQIYKQLANSSQSLPSSKQNSTSKPPASTNQTNILSRHSLPQNSSFLSYRDSSPEIPSPASHPPSSRSKKLVRKTKGFLSDDDDDDDDKDDINSQNHAIPEPKTSRRALPQRSLASKTSARTKILLSKSSINPQTAQVNTLSLANLVQNKTNTNLSSPLAQQNVSSNSISVKSSDIISPLDGSSVLRSSTLSPVPPLTRSPTTISIRAPGKSNIPSLPHLDQQPQNTISTSILSNSLRNTDPSHFNSVLHNLFAHPSQQSASGTTSTPGIDVPLSSSASLFPTPTINLTNSPRSPILGSEFPASPIINQPSLAMTVERIQSPSPIKQSFRQPPSSPPLISSSNVPSPSNSSSNKSYLSSSVGNVSSSAITLPQSVPPKVSPLLSQQLTVPISPSPAPSVSITLSATSIPSETVLPSAGSIPQPQISSVAQVSNSSGGSPLGNLVHAVKEALLPAYINREITHDEYKAIARESAAKVIQLRYCPERHSYSSSNPTEPENKGSEEDWQSLRTYFGIKVPNSKKKGKSTIQANSQPAIDPSFNLNAELKKLLESSLQEIRSRNSNAMQNNQPPET